MRVDASEINYDVQRSYAESYTRTNEVRVDIRQPQQTQASAAPAQIQDYVDLNSDDPRLTLIRLVIERLLGGKFGRTPRVGQSAARTAAVAKGASAPAASAAPAAPQWSVSISSREVYKESESLNVGARGTVTTSDGKQIAFDAVFTLSRNFEMETGTTLRAGNAVLTDPLFLDTGQGQALLVDDANGDGKLSGAGETFGASTGNGFAELASRDQDGNGWIDEADSVFGTLRLRLGDGSLATLESLGIGALSTQSVAGQFQYKDDNNQLTAVVRETGVYLTEDGGVGAMRQIDLANPIAN